MRALRVALLVASLSLLSRAPALAQDPPPPPAILPKAATYTWDKTSLRASFKFSEIVNEDLIKKLDSGIPTLIVAKTWVFEAGGTTPIALAPKSCRVVYDLWEEIYTVEMIQPGSAPSTVPVLTLDGVFRRCTQVTKMPVVERSRLKVGGNYLLQLLVEVNPISPDLMARIKRWVSRPKGSSTVGAGDALFGSFVGLFVAQIGSADRILRYKTPAFVVPAPPPPTP